MSGVDVSFPARERVCVSACASYELEAVRAAVQEQFDALHAQELLFPGCCVVIKPNLVLRSKPEEGLITHPAVVAAVAAELLERGAGSVTVAESPGGPYTPQGKRSKLFDIIRPILEADVLVDIAKLKTHGMMGLSAAVKNLFGCVPGLMKPELHCRFPEREAFAEMLVDLCCALKPALCVVDGIVGMEGNGPTGGMPRFIGALVSSRNPFAADVVCAKLIHQEPARVPYLKEGMARGVCPVGTEALDLWGVPPERLAVQDFVQPEASSVDFLERVPKFLRPLAERIATPVPRIQKKNCIGCGKCAESCPQHTIRIVDGHAVIQYRNCIRCYCCHEMCPKHVIDIKRFRLFRL